MSQIGGPPSTAVQLLGHLEAEPRVERDVPLLRALEVGGLPFGVDPVEHRSQQGRSDTLTLDGRVRLPASRGTSAAPSGVRDSTTKSALQRLAHVAERQQLAAAGGRRGEDLASLGGASTGVPRSLLPNGRLVVQTSPCLQVVLAQLDREEAPSARAVSARRLNMKLATGSSRRPAPASRREPRVSVVGRPLDSCASTVRVVPRVSDRPYLRDEDALRRAGRRPPLPHGWSGRAGRRPVGRRQEAT